MSGIRQLGQGMNLSAHECKGWLVPTVMIPMNVPVPMPPNPDAKPDDPPPPAAMQTIFRTTEAICLRCNAVYRFEIRQAAPPAGTAPEAKAEGEKP